MRITLDIESDEVTLKNFSKLNKIEYNDNMFNTFYTKYGTVFKPYDDSKKKAGKISTKQCDFSDVKVCDVISVSYIPLSQKYCEHYSTKTRTGTVIYIDSNNEDLLIWSTSPSGLTIQSLVVDGCSYYGMSRGYTVCIDKHM
jgi:hypothetical protein